MKPKFRGERRQALREDLGALAAIAAVAAFLLAVAALPRFVSDQSSTVPVGLGEMRR